jgi:hypothetical protein
MRVVLVLLTAAAAFAISLVVTAAIAPDDPAPAAPPGAAAADPWEEARAAMAELRRIASQSCAFVATSDASASAVFVERFRGAAGRYRGALQGMRDSAEPRPADLPAAPPALDELHLQICPDMVAAANQPAPEQTPAPAEGMDFAGLYGAHVLTPEQLDAAAYLAGWPMAPGWWPEMRLIVYCESGRNIFAYNGNDPNGGSYGLAQLNGRQHFDRSGENFDYRFDPIVNLRVALWLRTVRGHFGGAGGWKTCAELYGIS